MSTQAVRLYGIRTLRDFALYVIVALAAAFGATSAAAQDVKTVTADGYGGAKDNLRARDDAIDDALRRAVEQAVGTFVDAGTMTKNYELISDKVLTVAAGYVRKYDILSETREDDLLKVTVRAEVSMAPLKTDLIALELLKQRLGYPRVMVIGVERADSMEIQSRTVGTEIENYLVGKGFDLVDREFVEAAKARDVALSFDDYSQAQALGQRYGAEVVITYQADADYSGGEVLYGMPFERYRAAVTARIVKVDTAAMMAAVSSTDIGGAGGRQGGARKALENVGKKIAPDMFDKTVAAWQADIEGGTRLELVVTGADFNLANKIYQDLQELRQITSVGTPQMSRDTVTFEIKGSIQGFALAQRVASAFPDLVIGEVSQNRVKASVK